ncbi:hypothetical protein AB0H43_11820 [Hamadaea sp. NPDC050747]|uniref:hypothetical protein n=1 Tax=Hamadaea sp. NPDC050747 TaxID=3155789 RepID=UPI0033D0E6F6
MTADIPDLLARLSTVNDHNQRWENLNQIAAVPGARTALRHVRRYGPGRLRAAALDALAYLDGELGLEEADLAAVERLIRIRRRTDPLSPVMSIGTTWWCVRDLDQAAVLASLGLASPRPATYRLASSVMEIINEDDGCGLVYVGPQINGWTPIVGPWCDAFGDRAEEVRATAERLSAECGEVHAFYFSAYGDGTGWLVARNGVTIRRYSTLDPADVYGDPLPVEHDWMAARGVPGRLEDHRAYNDHGILVCVGEYAETMEEFYEANDVAAAISVDVGWRHPHDPVVHGSPVMAAVPGAGPIVFPPGLYEI